VSSSDVSSIMATFHLGNTTEEQDYITPCNNNLLIVNYTTHKFGMFV